MLTKTKKSEIVEALADKFCRQKIAIFGDFHGVSVAKATGLRRALKAENAEYKVAKKTLLDRALAVAGLPLRAKDLKGEISVTFGYGDEAAPARILIRFSKENETFKILGGILSGRVLNQAEALALARLPSREILLGQLDAALLSPLRGFAAVLQGNLRNLVVVLRQIKK